MTPYSVVVVAHEQPRQLLAALIALRQHAQPAEVLIVDNASTARLDGVIALSQMPTRVIRLDSHTSLGAALNVGIDTATHDLILIMHSDVLLESDPRPAVERISSTPNIGIAGGKLFRPGPHPRRIAQVGYRLGRGRVSPEPLGAHRWDTWNELMTVDAVSTACAILRRTDVRFDERYWFRLEDVDLCLQYAQRGLRTTFDPDLVATHQENGGAMANARAPWWTERAIASHMLFHERWCSRHNLRNHPRQDALRGPEASAFLASVDDALVARCPGLAAAS